MSRELVVGFAGLGAVLLSMAVTGLMRVFALRTNLLDEPTYRSSHTRPTPRGGGVGIVIASILGAGALCLAGFIEPRLFATLVLGGSAVAMIGFLDDRRGVSPLVRLMVHFAAAAIGVGLLGGLAQLKVGATTFELGGSGALLSVVGIVWLTNLFNFMDGIDGIAATEASFVAFASAALMASLSGFDGSAAVAVIVGAASLGFLVWNWPPARIFMGDVGSGFLGYAIGVIALSASKSDALNVIPSLILGGVFFVDATITLLRRASRGERVYEAHRTHAYQRLTDRWASHLRVTLFVLFVNLVWLLPLAIWSARRSEHAVWLLAVALAPLAVACHMIGSGQSDRTGPR